MESLTGLGWMWRALRGRSVTFALLFALLILGFSATAAFRGLLRDLQAPWLAWLLLPILFVAVLAKKEEDWWPDEARRARWARRLIYGSVVLAIILAFVVPKPPREPREPSPPRVKHHGPAGRR
jgi:4-hydroxybenzoate polyprenyltransferase